MIVMGQADDGISFLIQPQAEAMEDSRMFDRLKNIPITVPIGILGILTTFVVGTKTNRSEVRET